MTSKDVCLADIHLFLKYVKPSYIIWVSNESSWKLALELFLSSGDMHGSPAFEHNGCSSGIKWWGTAHLSRQKVMLAACHMASSAHYERLCWRICVSPWHCSRGWCGCFSAVTDCTVWTGDFSPPEPSHWQATDKIWSLVQPLYQTPVVPSFCKGFELMLRNNVGIAEILV